MNNQYDNPEILRENIFLATKDLAPSLSPCVGDILKYITIKKKIDVEFEQRISELNQYYEDKKDSRITKFKDREIQGFIIQTAVEALKNSDDIEKYKIVMQQLNDFINTMPNYTNT